AQGERIRRPIQHDVDRLPGFVLLLSLDLLQSFGQMPDFLNSRARGTDQGLRRVIRFELQGYEAFALPGLAVQALDARKRVNGFLDGNAERLLDLLRSR